MADEAGPSCRTSPNLVGACFSVRGRLFVSNGPRSVHITSAETGRVLDVLGRDAWAKNMKAVPPAVDALLASSPSSTEVEGDYVVCPFDRTHIARTQAVCIETASHLIARRR
jgi:hypothetical protein